MSAWLTVADLDACPWASCGPTALAALLKRSLVDVHPAFPNHTPKRTWTNHAQMCAAISRLGVIASQTTYREPMIWGLKPAPERKWPANGLVPIQFRGSWDQMPIHHPAQLQRSHWVAVAPVEGGAPNGEPWVFDVNALADDMNHGWLPRSYWEAKILAPVIASFKRATGGWWVRAGIEVALPAGGSS